MRGSYLIRAASRQGRVWELGVDWGIDSSSSGCSSGVAERLVHLPHGVEDDGELARHRDLRLSDAGTLGDPQAPGLQDREANLPRQDHIGGFIEVGGAHPVLTEQTAVGFRH